MKFSFPKSYLDDFFLPFAKKQKQEKLEKQDNEYISMPATGLYKMITEFLKDRKDDFPEYLGRTSSTSDDFYRRMFSKKEGGGYPLEYLDLFCCYLTQNNNTSLLEFFNINSTKELSNFIHSESLDDFNEIKNHEDILDLYKKKSLVPKSIQEKIKSIKINHLEDYTVKETTITLKTSSKKELIELPFKTKRTGNKITNKWRFVFCNKNVTNSAAEKLWNDLKVRLNLGPSNVVSDYVIVIYKELDEYIWECRKDQSILNNERLQKHVEDFLLFPDESSILQLFEKQEVENQMPRENGGNDLLSLDVLVSFIKGESITLQEYLEIPESEKLNSFLTKNYKEKYKEVTKENNLAQGDWYEDVEKIKKDYIEDDSPKLSDDIKDSMLKGRNRSNLGKIILGIIAIIIFSIFLYHFFSPKENLKIVKKEGMLILIVPFHNDYKKENNSLSIEKFVKDELLFDKKLNNDLFLNIEILPEEFREYSYNTNLEKMQSIGDSLGADIIIWGDYIVDSEDHFSGMAQSLLIKDLKRVLPIDIPYMMQAFGLEGITDNLSRRQFGPIHLSKYGNEKYVDDIKKLLLYITAFQYVQQGEFQLAFNLLKDDVNKTNLWIIRSILMESVNILFSAEKYYLSDATKKNRHSVVKTLFQCFKYYHFTKQDVLDEQEKKYIKYRTGYYARQIVESSFSRRKIREQEYIGENSYAEDLLFELETLEVLSQFIDDSIDFSITFEFYEKELEQIKNLKPSIKKNKYFTYIESKYFPMVRSDYNLYRGNFIKSAQYAMNILERHGVPCDTLTLFLLENDTMLFSLNGIHLESFKGKEQILLKSAFERIKDIKKIRRIEIQGKELYLKHNSEIGVDYALYSTECTQDEKNLEIFLELDEERMEILDSMTFDDYLLQVRRIHNK